MSKILIIPAAGAATRLRPLTSTASKAMLPVNGKPVIAYIIDQNIDLYDVIVVVYGQSDDLPKFIHTRYNNTKCKIKLVKQQAQTGVLSAVLDGMQILDERSPLDQLTVWLGDTIVCDYTSQFQSNEVVVSSVSDWSRWCLVDDSITYYDKPVQQPPTDKALVGIYTFTSLLDAYRQTCSIINSGIKVKNEFQMSQLLECYNKSTTLVATKEWYDCGDFQSLYESKARLITKLSRPDNKISVDVNRSAITKSGPRCKNEIYWYNDMKELTSAKPYLPQLYDSIQHRDLYQYTIAYCPGATLQEVFAFEDLKQETVEYTLKRTIDAYFDCFGDRYIETCKNDKATIMDDLINTKLDRVYDYGTKYPSIDKNEIAQYAEYTKFCYNRLSSLYEQGLVKTKQYGHGDFHFANIIFDYNTGSVKFIDPKGPSTQTIELYDLVKFYQSFYGDYLWIKTDTVVNATLKEQVIKYCDKYFANIGFDVTIIKQLVPILMGSVLGFHDDQQKHQVKIWKKTMELINENCIL